MTLPTATALVCLLIAARLLLFARGGATHRPRAGLFAYLLAVAAGSVGVFELFGLDSRLPQLVLHLALLLALLAVRGNVVELFRTTDNRQSWLAILLRKEKWI
ncbi:MULTISPECIES: phage holin family protein [Chromobacterium]|uniref:phage holin family protein n=1 Tax=Chromobacterium TaxID=535 RepID=UPI0005B81CF4|nr:MULTISPECIES: phage holin family protein [Chromobacterium]BBH14528.1 hypothetical protein CH06BL_37760 [Chromobacterium haemolyticum]